MPPIPELEDGRGRRMTTNTYGNDDDDDGGGGGGAPNETTRLMSGTSTSNTNNNSRRSIDDGSIPLTSSYGDLKDSLEVQLKDLAACQGPSSSKSKKTTTTTCNNTVRHILPTKKYVLCILVLGIALLLGMSWLVVSSMGVFENHSSSVESVDGHNKNGSNNNHRSSHGHGGGGDDDKEQFVTGDGRPFSLLHPVLDLGLPVVTRSEGASPDWSYFGQELQLNNNRNANLHNNGEKGRSNDGRRRAIPTNAWYQNLLLARGKYPSNLQRAYPSPYLVDVVGMIPGLRVHSSHINANSMVMQLSFNEDYGLVVGATNDKSFIITDDDGEEHDDTPLPHTYKVTEMTDVGITLEWVRCHTYIDATRPRPFWYFYFPPRLYPFTHSIPNSSSNPPDLSTLVSQPKPTSGCHEHDLKHCSRNGL